MKELDLCQHKFSQAHAICSKILTSLFFANKCHPYLQWQLLESRFQCTQFFTKRENLITLSTRPGRNPLNWRKKYSNSLKTLKRNSSPRITSFQTDLYSSVQGWLKKRFQNILDFSRYWTFDVSSEFIRLKNGLILKLYLYQFNLIFTHFTQLRAHFFMLIQSFLEN